MADEYVSTTEACKRLGLEYQTIRKHIKSGELKGYRTRKGGPYRVSVQSIEKFIDDRLAVPETS